MPLIYTLENTMKELDINQKTLAEISGVRPNTISELRKGDVGAIRVETLESLLDAINRLSDKSYGLDAIIKYERS